MKKRRGRDSESITRSARVESTRRVRERRNKQRSDHGSETHTESDGGGCHEENPKQGDFLER